MAACFACCFVLKGWTPTNDIESVVVQIRAQMVVGKARIDFDATSVTQVSAAWSESNSSSLHGRHRRKWGSVLRSCRAMIVDCIRFN